MSQKEKKKKFEKCGKMKKSVRKLNKLNLFSLCQRLAEEIKTVTWEIGDDKIWRILKELNAL